ncbi:unnamed protein product [Arctogadus glacialis]
MRWSWLLTVGVVVLSLGATALGEMGLEVPEYDGHDRVHHLSAKNYKSVMKRYDVMVLYYHRNVDGSRTAAKQLQIEELALEVSEVSGRVFGTGVGSSIFSYHSDDINHIKCFENTCQRHWNIAQHLYRTKLFLFYSQGFHLAAF